jgi:hypothetical protein
VSRQSLAAMWPCSWISRSRSNETPQFHLHYPAPVDRAFRFFNSVCLSMLLKEVWQWKQLRGCFENRVLVGRNIDKVMVWSPDCKSWIWFEYRSPKFEEWEIFQQNFTKRFNEPRLTNWKLRLSQAVPEVVCPKCS